MLVEFVGLPASGKSTTRSRASTLLRDAGCRAFDVSALDRADETLPAYLRQNTVAGSVYRYEQLRAAHPGFMALIDRIGADHLHHKSLIIALCVRLQIHDCNPLQGRIFVTDEGLLHRLAHLVHITARGQEAPGLIRAICDSMPKPDLIVAMQAEAETCHDRALVRLAARKGLPVSDARVRRRIERFHGDVAGFAARRQTIDTGLERLIARGVPVTRIPADATLDAAAALARDAVLAARAGAGPPQEAP